MPLDVLLSRPRLQDRLDDVLARRLAILIAPAGYGKSSLVTSWATRLDDSPAWCLLDPEAAELRVLVERVDVAIRDATGIETGLSAAMDGATTEDRADSKARAEGFAALLADRLDALLRTPLVLVLDDLQELGSDTAATGFVDALIRGAPPELHIVITSRHPVSFPVERLRGQGQVVEIRGDELAFDRAETATLLQGLEPSAADLLDEVIRLTQGWPALTRLVLESLRTAPPEQRADVLARSQGPDGPLLAYIAEEVLGREPPETIEVLRIASRFETISPDLLEAIGSHDAADVLESLTRRALFVERRTDGPDRAFALHTLVRDYALANLPLDEVDRQRIHAVAADRLAARGRPVDALRQRLLAGQTERIAAVLEADGLELARAGGLDVVVDAVRSIPEDERSTNLEIVLGDALLRRGEWDGAVTALRRAGHGLDRLPAAIAWRLGFIQHERGEVVDALATFGRADIDHGDASDRAQVAAWHTIALWQREDVEDARAWAAKAADVAAGSKDARAMAAVLAAAGAVAHMDGDGAGSIDAFRRAVGLAQKAGDLLLEVRFRTDLGYNLAFQGRFADALRELDVAVSRGAALGNSTVPALALADRGQAHVGLGRFEEAAADLATARRLYALIGSAWSAYPTVKEADVRRMRGDAVMARQAYRDVIAMSTALSRPWFLPEAILGLAASTVDEDTEQALVLVDDAMRRTSSVMNAATPLAAARTCLIAGRTDEATRYARSSMAIAEARNDRASLAGALDVLAAVEPDPARARVLLARAETVWLETGSPYGLASHRLVLARVVGGADGRSMALRAAEEFRRMGARRVADRAVDLADDLVREPSRSIEVRALGGFQVVRDGTPIPVSEWRSKKARDLLKVLVARRGRPISRDHLCELLWPDDDPGPLPNRLSVALATIRAVLDPERAQPQDHYIRADKAAVALDLEHVSVDLETYLAAAGDALARLRRAGDDRATVIADLEAVEALYRGDFLEEDAYDDWATGLRDEALAVYLDVTRALAANARATGDADAEVRLHLRILERDPYDEPAHLGVIETLARVGRHGEARRRYLVYRSRMSELELEAAPYPGMGRVDPAADDLALSPA